MRTLAAIVLVVFIAVFTLASSPYLLFKCKRFIMEHLVYSSRYGDLYKLSNLKKFKEEKRRCHPSANKKTNNVHLYIIGDSFTEELTGDAFASSNYTYLHWNRIKVKDKIQLNKQEKNILILESVERSLAGRMLALNSMKKESSSNEIAPFKFKCDDNLNDIFFQDPISLYIKELKAELNYKVFGRIDKSVVLSDNGEWLFYKQGMDSTIRGSSLNEISKSYEDSIVAGANALVGHYKNMGFSVVYLSFLPNKESVVEPVPVKYNHLIERIESNRQLQVPVISTYNWMKGCGKDYYYISDTHWNCDGETKWLNEVNKRIE